ncbi:hypothetical protein [Microbacterium sp.]|uniref:hypothetical protein n=1 Tax=Microbacterium sp. TaxID=51671 RepID=UPI0039E5336F
MRMGTRWSAGSEPPAAVPAALRETISAVERDLPPGAPRPSWTLTWLEGRPIAELDTGVIVEQTRTGAVVARHDPDDEFA